jgi:hypothetical protein
MARTTTTLRYPGGFEITGTLTEYEVTFRVGTFLQKAVPPEAHFFHLLQSLLSEPEELLDLQVREVE